ncbi:type II toxin-antitoxin system VapC family toxin [Natronosporangium hydrolyticum]|uniref:Type II toxin-antitoxin system VapC family toxin n=1 Tax=Natronosporangium hydrolyticum TaxID=2811111 RepID=A0A895YM52_9ACTN|nr:PIN domain-containing protein [Natronosporangium hydrolyticum]QSB16393.1 type II toxin-antitoxin system VapC family toxin [Natronosporangium hydrolyticum]
MIVVDTGPLVAALNSDDKDHERCLRLLETHQGRLLVPGPVLTEVC